MKRVYLFTTLLLAAFTTAQAQWNTNTKEKEQDIKAPRINYNSDYNVQAADGTFQFVDAAGKVVPDGSTIEVNVAEKDDFGSILMKVPLQVQKVSDGAAAVALYETIDDMPNGSWQTCAFGNCMSLSQSGYSAKGIVTDNSLKSIETEWLPVEGQYAEWTATLQIHLFNIQKETVFGQEMEVPGTLLIGNGPSVKVHFNYTAEAGIDTPARTVTATDNKIYTIDGRQATPATRGLVIVRSADGKTHKVVY